MPDLDPDRLGRAIDHLYEAAVEPSLWPEALVDFATAAGGMGGMLLNTSPGTRGWFECSPNLRPCAEEFFAEGWAPLNVRTTRGLPFVRAGRPFITESLLFVPGELDRQPIQAEFFSRHGLRSFIGFELAPGEILASIERGTHEAADWELAALHRLTPHLRRIGNLALLRGNSRSQGVLDGLSLVRRAAILLDHRGRVLRMNTEAERLYPMAFEIAVRKLSPLHRPTAGVFRALVDAAVARYRPHELRPMGSLAVPRTEGQGRSLVVHAAPIVGQLHGFFDRAKAVLVLVDPDEAIDVSDTTIATVFGMTPTEARLSQRLLTGRGLDAAANELNVTKETVRKHLASIFRKTGTRRQAELIGLLSRIFASSSR